MVHWITQGLGGAVCGAEPKAKGREVMEDWQQIGHVFAFLWTFAF